MLNLSEDVGRYFGYPLCCIKAYDQVVSNSGLKTAEQANPRVHKHTGFIPCPTHAKQVFNGEIALESLIRGRICPLPFPEEPSIDVLDEYLVNQLQMA